MLKLVMKRETMAEETAKKNKDAVGWSVAKRNQKKTHHP